MKAIITEQALREFLSDYIDQAIIKILQNKCGSEETQEELVNPTDIKPTFITDEDSPIEPAEETEEQVAENTIRAEIKKILKEEFGIDEN